MCKIFFLLNKRDATYIQIKKKKKKNIIQIFVVIHIQTSKKLYSDLKKNDAI